MPICGHPNQFLSLEANLRCECGEDEPSHDGGREYAVPYDWQVRESRDGVLRLTDGHGEVVDLTFRNAGVYAVTLGLSFYLPTIVYG